MSDHAARSREARPKETAALALSPDRRHAMRAALEASFQQKLNDAGLRHRLGVTFEPEGPALSTLFDAKQVRLNLHPENFERFEACDAAARNAALSHEVCHLLAMPDCGVPAPTFDGPMVDVYMAYVDLYRELLAHQAFMRRYPEQREAFVRYAKDAFHPDQPWSAACRPVSEEEGTAALLWKLTCILHLFYDALAFHVLRDESFTAWTRARPLPAIAALFGYVVEDLEDIAARPIPYDDALHLTVGSFVLMATNIDLWALQRDELVFHRPPRELVDERFDAGLLERWSSRPLRFTLASTHELTASEAREKGR